MAFSFDRKYLVAWSLTLLVLGAFSVLSLRSTAELRANLASVDQGHRELQALTAVKENLLEMETGARGFLLTSEPEYLAPYLTAIDRFGGAMAQLEQGAGPSGELAELRRLADAKRQHMAQLMSLATHDNAAALALLRAGSGRAVMEAVQSHLDRRGEALSARLVEQRQAAEASVRTNQRIAAILGVSLALTLVTIQLLMYRELQARQKLDEAEQEATRALERRVEMRTGELQRTSRALALNERKLRSLFESVPETILTIDPGRCVAMANPAAAATFGVPVGDLIGTPVTDWIPRVPGQAHLLDAPSAAELAAAADGPVRRLATVTARRHDGSSFPADATFSCSGGDDACTVVLRDITARQRAELEMRQSEARLRKVLSVLPDAVIVDAGGRIHYVNAGAARLFGAEEAQLTGLPPLQLVHAGSRDLARTRTEELLAGTPITPTVELQIVRFDGMARSVLSTATAIDDHGERAVVVVMRDVTDLRRMQRELAASHSDLQRLVAAQGQIAENERRRIARELHDDLQQTMAAIKMDLAAADEQVIQAPERVPPLLASARELANAAIASTRRIINDLRPQILDDLGLVPALQNLAAEFGRRTGIDCRFVTLGASEAETTGSADVATCLYRVAQEALNNVAKHAAARHATLTLAADAFGLVLRVEDDGRGIASDEHRKLGSFGLIGMHERVRGFGGTLSVTSRPTGGTAVVAALPAQVPPAAPPGDGFIENTQSGRPVAAHHGH